MLECLARRWPVARVLVHPARVQGDGAADSVAAAVRTLNRHWSAGAFKLDAIIIGRGGGSTEDLWAFNEEVVADAIFESRIPVVSAIGHEIDVTVADLVADHRALTPSHAVAALTPDHRELLRDLDALRGRLDEAAWSRVHLLKQKLDAFAQRRPFRRPGERLLDASRRLDDLAERLERSGAVKLDRLRDRVAAVAARLDSLSPLNVLARGYSLTRSPDGGLVRDADRVEPGDDIVTTLARGEIVSRVVEVRPAG